jgi:energy-coupling factor transporter ATP-binding protein EcfA2
MSDNLKKIYQVFDPEPLLANQGRLYVDLDAVRGSTGLIGRLAQNIRLSNHKPICQLIAGHRGSGKSTELRRLQGELEKGADKFFTVFCEILEDIEPNDVDFPDVLMAIIRQTAEQLNKRLSIKLKPGYFKQRWEEAKDILSREVDLTSLDLDVGLAKFSAAMKSSPNTRIEIRKLLEPRTSSWIEAANDVISKAALELSKKDYKGLVVIVDGLDKMTLRPHPQVDCSTAEYLFVQRHSQLTAFNCHLLYTMPIALAYSCRERDIASLYGSATVVPMTMIRNADGRKNKQGFEKFRELIRRRLEKAGVKEKDAFENDKTRDEIIKHSGGQPRELITLIRDSMIEGQLPITISAVNKVIKKAGHAYARQLREEHWAIIEQVRKKHTLKRTQENDALCMELLDNRAILQYENGGEWYGLNPLLPQRST